MPIATGSISSLAFAVEGAYDIAPTAGYRAVPFRSETLGENINTFTSEDIRGNRQVSGIRGGNQGSGGDFNADFGSNSHFHFWQHLLATPSYSPDSTEIALTAYTANMGDFRGNDGAAARMYVCTQGGVVTAGDVTTNLTGTTVGATEALTNTVWQYLGTNGTTYKHVLTGGVDWPAVGLTFEKKIADIPAVGTDQYFVYTGCRMNTMALAIPQEGILGATWSVLGVTGSQAQAAKDVSNGIGAAVTGLGYTGFETFILLNGTHTIRPIRDGSSLNITNNIDEGVYVLGSRNRRALPEGTRTITGQVNTYLETLDEYNFWKNEDTIAVDYVMINAANGNTVKIHIPAAKLTGDGTPKISGPGVITGDYQMSAFTDGSNDITVTYSNTTANMETIGDA